MVIDVNEFTGRKMVRLRTRIHPKRVQQEQKGTLTSDFSSRIKLKINITFRAFSLGKKKDVDAREDGCEGLKFHTTY